MKEIKNIQNEIKKKSTGCFKDGEGDIYYLNNGWYHRENGPAIERSNGNKIWYFFGKGHRIDGPAVEMLGLGIKLWYFHGMEADSKEQFFDPQWRRKIEIKGFL